MYYYNSRWTFKLGIEKLLIKNVLNDINCRNGLVNNRTNLESFKDLTLIRDELQMNLFDLI